MSLLGMTRYSNGTDALWPRAYNPNGPIQKQEWVYRVAGLDLGKTVDPSAFSMIQQHKYASDFIGPRELDSDCWALKELGEAPLNTDYDVIIQNVLAHKTIDVLLIDGTGAKPFIDWFKKEASRVHWKTRIIAINIASSAMIRSTWERGKDGQLWWTIPKRELVSSLQVMEHKRILKLNPAYPAVKRLRQQLGDFQENFSRSGMNKVFGAKQGSHDDLVMSLSMPCWWALRHGCREAAILV